MTLSRKKKKRMSLQTYFSTLIITYLAEAHVYRNLFYIDEHEIIFHISSLVAVMGTKENISVPSENKLTYVEHINKNAGILMIVLDQLVLAGHIERKADPNPKYKLNMESDYIQKFIKSHSAALKYISHPAYAICRDRPNDADAFYHALRSKFREHQRCEEVKVEVEEVKVEVEDVKDVKVESE